MSEQQYYEFRAVDRPLTALQQKELRGLSSRAKITATIFVNEYNYGDFAGNPSQLMERYFDLHIYHAKGAAEVFTCACRASSPIAWRSPPSSWKSTWRKCEPLGIT